MGTFSEIMEQRERIGEILAKQRGVVTEIANEVLSRRINYIFLAARGTSDNAGRYANYLFGNRNRMTLALATPSLFTHYRTPPNLANALVLGISQSGQSPDIVSVLEEGRRQHCLTLAITNAPESPLAENAEAVLDLGVGAETGVAATKTYTAELMLLAMLSAALENGNQAWDELEKVQGWIGQTLSLDKLIEEQVQRYRYMERCVVLGRGYNYCTAFEWALKLKELTYIEAESYSSADFLHGPVAMIERGYPVLSIAMKGQVLQDTMETQLFLKSKLNAELVTISNKKQSLELADTAIEMPAGVSEWLSPIAAIVAAQLFAYHLTRAKGYDPDHPRTIQKVTKTT